MVKVELKVLVLQITILKQIRLIKLLTLKEEYLLILANKRYLLIYIRLILDLNIMKIY